MKKTLIIILFSLVPLYGGMRENAYSEIQNTSIYIKSVEPKIKSSGSLRARDLIQKAKTRIFQAKRVFLKRNYRLSVIYAKEARELASFAVKIAIGRVRARGGLIICKNSLLYLSQREDIKKHYLQEIKNAKAALDEAHSYYTREEYKKALLKTKECITTIHSITANSPNFAGVPEKVLKEKLRAYRKLIKKTDDRESILLYQRAEEAFRNGHYKLSLMLLNALERRLKNKPSNDRLLIETMEKKIQASLKTRKIPPQKRQKINLLLSKYKDAKRQGNYQKAQIILENINKILSSE